MSTQPIFTSLRFSAAPAIEDARIIKMMHTIVDLGQKLARVQNRLTKLEREQKDAEIKSYQEPKRWLSSDLSEVVMKLVCEEFHTHPQDVIQRTNVREIVKMRRLLIMLLRDKCHYSFPRIGTMLGFHHTTIMHCYQIGKQDKKMCEMYERLAGSATVPRIPAKPVIGADATCVKA